MHFSHIKEIPADPILKITPLYLRDKNPHKLNLGVGAYRTAEGNPFLFSAVKEAEKRVFEKKLDKEYLPIDGDSEYLHLSQKLLFPNEKEQKNCISIQTIGGSSALRLGADFLSLAGLKLIYLPSLTWPNHENVLGNTLKIEHYPYYDKESFSLDEKAFLNALLQAPKHSIILLHGCCHNPTGVDPSFSLWEKIASITKEKDLVPLFDIAYQGLAHSIEEDRKFLVPFIESDQSFFITYSYSKNMGLYGERIGHFTYFSKDDTTFSPILSNLKRLVRKNYSSPALEGARLVKTVLEDPSLKALWQKELSQIKGRVDHIRLLLSEELSRKFSLSYQKVKEQKGLFALLPLSPKQVDLLQEQFSIYMPSSGRANLAGLSEQTIPYFLDALTKVLA